MKTGITARGRSSKCIVLRDLVKFGDFVGLFYPHEDKWFSMYQNTGHKQTCPGSTPTEQYGFHRQDSWFYCGAEVFQVFAKGKANGVQITDQDIAIIQMDTAM